jgi:hypothetical protein
LVVTSRFLGKTSPSGTEEEDAERVADLGQRGDHPDHLVRGAQAPGERAQKRLIEIDGGDRRPGGECQEERQTSARPALLRGNGCMNTKD